MFLDFPFVEELETPKPRTLNLTRITQDDWPNRNDEAAQILREERRHYAQERRTRNAERAY